MNYQTIYNLRIPFLDDPIIWFSIIIIIIFPFGLREAIKSKDIGKRLFAFVGIPIYLVMSIVTLYGYWEIWQKFQLRKNLLNNGAALVVEGKVENYQPFIDHTQPERFSVNGVQFSYWGYYISPRYRNTSSHSPIKNGVYVRLSYLNEFEDGGLRPILKVEIARKD